MTGKMLKLKIVNSLLGNGLAVFLFYIGNKLYKVPVKFILVKFRLTYPQKSGINNEELRKALDRFSS